MLNLGGALGIIPAKRLARPDAAGGLACALMWALVRGLAAIAVVFAAATVVSSFVLDAPRVPGGLVTAALLLGFVLWVGVAWLERRETGQWEWPDATRRINALPGWQQGVLRVVFVGSVAVLAYTLLFYDGPFRTERVTGSAVLVLHLNLVAYTTGRRRTVTAE